MTLHADWQTTLASQAASRAEIAAAREVGELRRKAYDRQMERLGMYAMASALFPVLLLCGLAAATVVGWI